jgi:hypothetical protein
MFNVTSYICTTTKNVTPALGGGELSASLSGHFTATFIE